MKSIILVAVAFVTVVVAAPAEPEPVKILRSDVVQQPNGPFSVDFETANGIRQHMEGQLKEVFDEENKPHSVLVVRGNYAYINKEGDEETISYYADETGYHAEGPSIPKGPEARR